ncbi:minor tail protein [Gordonia phage VanLee]|uniref:Minor tail protein n=1 Tax=Gordonia phage VanLee TaxID=2845816 RepID=A0A8F2D9C3_9CAUD|nr:minor tail protein [Gordonia phage VanLee]QWS68140.1 minor tail protein [Gordonia phage VanLee]
MTSPNYPGPALPEGTHTGDTAGQLQQITENSVKQHYRGPIEVAIANARAQAMNRMIMQPFSHLLAWLLNSEPEDWDTVAELKANLIPAIIKRVLGPLGRFITVGSDDDLDDEVAEELAPIRGAVTGVQDLAENIVAGVSGGIAAGVGAIAGSFSAIAQLLGMADGAQRIAIAAQQQIADLQNESTDPNFNGRTWSQIFSGAEGTGLSTDDWFGDSQIVIRGNSGYAGVLDVADVGHYAKQPVVQFVGDYQTASVVLGNKTTGGPQWTSVCIHADALLTQAVFARVNETQVQLGKVSRAGASWTWTPWYTASREQRDGDLLRIKSAANNNYLVQINGRTVLSGTDVANSIQKGSAYRYAAFTQERAQNIFGVQLGSYRIASFALADWLPPGAALTTPGWRLRRGTNTSVAQAVDHGATALMPSGFYTSNDQSSLVTINDLGTGQVAIQETGYYRLGAASSNMDNSDTSGAIGTQRGIENAWRPTFWVLFIDGTPAIGPIAAGAEVDVYLAAGQVIRPGVAAVWPMSGTLSGTDGSDGLGYGRSNITHLGAVGGAASFSGRKVA